VRPLIGFALSLALVLVMTSANTTMAADPTTSVTITKYAADGTTILDQTTVTWEWMRDNLPVQGDGTTHYYHQGPTFDDSTFEKLWDPGETVNIDSRDYGAAKGTDVKDLCDLVGGASPGDTIKIKASDNFSKWFDYEDVYTPEPEQGKMVITWYTTDIAEGAGGYVPDYTSGMRLVFFAETLNPDGKHVFGDWDMHETLAESRWHYYYDGKYWPSSSGLAVKWVRYIEIHSAADSTPTPTPTSTSTPTPTSISAPTSTPTPTPTPTPTLTPTPAATPTPTLTLGEERASSSLAARANVTLSSVGIALDRDSIDFGDVKPGQNSAIETVVVTNTGSKNIDVTLEVAGEDDAAQSFYEQSLYVNNDLYGIDDVIANILTDGSQSVDTQLRVPASWNGTGEQRATFTFWATASN
jgi:hypothetical protein